MSNHISRIREMGALAKMAEQNLQDQNAIDKVRKRMEKRFNSMERMLTLLRKTDRGSVREPHIRVSPKNQAKV